MIRLPGETFEDYSEEMTKEEEQELFDTAVKEMTKAGLEWVMSDEPYEGQEEDEADTAYCDKLYDEGRWEELVNHINQRNFELAQKKGQI